MMLKHPQVDAPHSELSEKTWGQQSPQVSFVST